MNIWTTVLHSLKKKVSQQAYNDWLKPTAELSQDGKTLRVRVPNDRFGEHIKKHYLPMIQEALEKNDFGGMKVDFVTEAQQLLLEENPKMEQPAPRPMSEMPRLIAKYTFDNFVPGPSCQ